MGPIDPSDVRRVLTEEQLRRGANGIAYRVEQLVYGTLALTERPKSRDVRQLAITNALVESALVHARALSYFLTSAPHDARNLHIDYYSKTAWRDGSTAITGVAEEIISAASHHLAHSSIGGAEWEPHPGDWPLVEMAVILSRGLVDFVATLGQKYADRAALFGETPLFEYANLEAGGLPLTTPTSDHPEIGALTTSLQAYLAPTGWPAVIHSRASRSGD